MSAYQGFYERGLVHQMIEDSESAIDDFQIAIEIAKTLDWKNCLVTRAGPFLALQQEKPKVIQKIEKAKNIVMQAKKAFIEEKYQYSLELSEKAIKAYKASEKSYLYAAFSHFKLKNYDEIKIYLNNFYIIFTKNNKGSKIPSEVKKFEQDLDLRSIALNKYNGWLKMLPELMPNEIIVDTIKSVFSGGWIKKEKEEKLKELIEECLKSAKFPIGFSSEDRKVLSEGISKGIKSFFIHKPSGKSGKSASHVRFNIKTKSISKDAGLARSIDQAITDSMEAISQRIQQKQIQFPEESLVESIVECDKVLNKGFENIEKNILEINRIINNTSGSAIMKKSPKKNLPLIQSEKLVSTSLPILKSNPFSSLKNQQPRIEVIALYDFTSENERELSFQRGDKMHVTDQSNGEWWHAEFKGRAGYIPSNFIQIQDKKDLPEIQNRNNDIISDSNVSKKSKINIQRESKNSNQSHIDESKNQTKDTPKTPNLKKENPVSSKTRNSVVIKSQNERIKDLNEALKILTESTQKKILSLSEVNKEYQEFEKEALQLKSTNFYISRGQFYFESAENEMSSTRKEILYQNALQDYKKALNYDPFLEGIPDEIDKIQALLKGNSSQGGNHGFFATVATNVALNQKPKEQSMPTRDNLTAEQLQELEKIKTQLRQQGPGRF